jgi:hypothetical protein
MKLTKCLKEDLEKLPKGIWFTKEEIPNGIFISRLDYQLKRLVKLGLLEWDTELDP